MPGDRRGPRQLSTYLVFFVAGPVDDALADAVVGHVRALGDERAWGTGGPPGWFDDADAPSPAERTTGAFLRTDDLAGADPRAVYAAALTLSADLGVEVEVQFREEPLGRVRSGTAEPALHGRFA